MSALESYTYRWFINRFADAKDQAIAFSQPISRELFVQRPSEGVWSVAECYSHLNEFGGIYRDNIQKGMESAPGQLDEPERPFPPRLLWKAVIKLFAPPYKMKLKTVKPFQPAEISGLNKKLIIGQFASLQDRFIDLLKTARAEEIDLNATKVPNPLLKFIKMTLAESLAVAEVHQRRHMWQAEQIFQKIKG